MTKPKNFAPMAFGLIIGLGLTASAMAKDCIGVISAGAGYAFWNSVEAGAKKAGHELGYTIYFRGPRDERNVNAQKYIIDIISKLNCKGLVIAPNAPVIAEDVALLKEKGIPTVYIDRDIGGADVLNVVATDNFNAGKLAAREMAKALKGNGNVALLGLKNGIPSTDARETGFVKEATKLGLKIVISEYVGTTIGDVRTNSERVLKGSTTHIDGIFTPNETTSIGTSVVLRELDMTSKVVHIGFDSGDYLYKALADGRIYGLVIQRPFEMGYQGVYIVHRKIHGEGANSGNVTIDTGVIFATKSNMNEPEVSKILRMN